MAACISVFFWSFGVSIGAVISPGPVSATIVTEGIRRGGRVGPLVSTGHALIELILVVALVLGLGQVLAYPFLVTAIGILGGLFLVWMGGSILRQAVRKNLVLPGSCTSKVPITNRNLIGLGIATTVSNPFWYLWWVGVGGTYVLSSQEQGLLAVVAFYLGHISADYIWNSLLSFAAASGRSSWLTERVYRGVLLVCGLFLFYTAIRFLYTSLV